MRFQYLVVNNVLACGLFVSMSSSAALCDNKIPDKAMKIIAEAEARYIWQRTGDTAFLYMSKMAIDADGSPNAYHPVSDFGIDEISNGGKPGNWWAVVTDDEKPTGQPIFQGENDPSPGFYVSTTSLMDLSKSVKDPARYVDSTKIPFFVLPTAVMKAGNARLGDFAVVFNTHNNKMEYAIFADTGPANLIGEGSIALANALKINPNARNGGIANGIVFLVFPHSGNEKPRSAREIKREGSKKFKEWGGITLLKTLIPAL